MPDETQYTYRRHESSLLRAPEGTYEIEIYRPKTDSFVPYETAASIEEWFDGIEVRPKVVDGLKKELRSLRQPAKP